MPGSAARISNPKTVITVLGFGIDRSMHMPILKSDRLPKYRKHKASGQAIVTLAGKDHYLGPHGTQTSKLEYDRLVAQWLAKGRPTREQQAKEITVTQLLAEFWKFAEGYYVKNGKPTSTASNYKIAIRQLRSEYGELKVSDLRPLTIARLQQLMVDQGYARPGVPCMRQLQLPITPRSLLAVFHRLQCVVQTRFQRI